MRGVLGFLLALFIGVSVSANDTFTGEGLVALPAGTVKGMILDSTTRGAIEYATIGIYRINDSSLVNGLITGVDGIFVFKDLPAGEYYIDANFIGYVSRRISPISISSQRTALDLGNLLLHPDVTRIEEVTVVAQSQRVEYKIDKKVVNIAQDLLASGGSLVNALENTPSIEVDVEGNVSLRGSGNFQLLIDGKPSIIGGSEGLQQIPASAVQSLEIITSPSAKYDPDGASGIINVIMKKQKNNGVGGIANVSVGTRNKYAADLLLNFRRNKLNYFIGGEFGDRHNFNEGENERRTYLNDTTTTKLSESNGFFRRKSYNLKSGIDYALTDKSSLSLSGVVGSREFFRDFTDKSQWFTEPATRDSFYTTQRVSGDNDFFYNFNLDFLKKYDENGHQLMASVYYESAREDEEEEDIIRSTDMRYIPSGSEPKRTRSKTETPERILRAELDYSKPLRSGKIEVGLQSRWDSDEAKYIYEDFVVPVNEWLQNDSISNSLEYLDAMQSAYFIYSAKLGKFEYQAGLRAEYNKRSLDQKTIGESFTYEKLHFFPSFYLTRKISDAHQVQFTYSRRIQRPRERDLNPFKQFNGPDDLFFGNPALKPEFSNAFEANYQYTHKRGFVSLETYYRETRDKITRLSGRDSIAEVFTTTTINADKDNSLGVELMTNWELARWWQLNVTGNFFRYQLNGQVEGEEVKSVTTSWRTNFSSSFAMMWDTRFQISGFYNGPSNTLQGKREGFFVANVALRKEMLKKQLSVSLNVRDILSTGTQISISEGSNFYTYNKGRRESPVVMLNLTFRINNYRQAANRQQDDRDSDEGGMDDMM